MADLIKHGTLGAVVLLLGLGCSDNGFTQRDNADFFQQQRRNTFDLLLVVDNSCSMIEEQKKLATNFDAFIQYFEGSDVDWQLGVVTTDMEQEQFSGHLIGGDDEIVLVDPDGVARDEVTYDKTWAVAEGQAYSLDPSWRSVVDNDILSHWCLGTGSPGADNESCAAEQGPGIDTSSGSILITEFMADPTVDDALGEWVEITNVGATDQDLTGWSLADEGRNAYAIPDGTMIAAGAKLVFARSTDTAVNGGVTADLAVGEDFTLNNDVLILNQDTLGPDEIFAEMVSQGITGSGAEMGLEAARRAVSEPLISGENAGFLREEASFNVLVVSDEEDSSPDPVQTYLSDFADLKGEAAYRNHQLMNVSAVAGIDSPEFEGMSSCSSENGDAAYGSRYVAAVDWTAGLEDSICDEDFSPIVGELGLTLSGLLLEWELSRIPVLESLEVSLYDTDGETKLQDLTIDIDFTYIEDRNVIHFEYDQVPDSEQWILVNYTVRSGG